MFHHCGRYGKNTLSLFLIILIALLFILNGQGFAFGENPSPEHKFDKFYLKNFSTDFLDVVESPRNWGKKDFYTLSAVLGAGIFMYAVDQDINSWFQNNRSAISENASRFITNLGQGVVLGAILASLYVSGEFFHQDSLRKTALIGFESLVISGVLVASLKFFLGRSRPFNGESSSVFRPLSLKSSYQSFPSGHATSAFAVAAVIADQSKTLAVDLLTYTFAGFVAVSRVHEGKHWTSDVLVGSALGYFIGKKVSSLNRNRDAGKTMVSFLYSPDNQALSISLCF